MGEYKDLAKRACCIVEGALNGDISKVNAKELGEVADIIKDMEEATMYCEQAKYYKKITEAMDKSSPEVLNEYMGKYVPEYNMIKENPMVKNYPLMRYGSQPVEYYDPYNYDGTKYYSNGNNNSNSMPKNFGNKMYYNGAMNNDSKMMNDIKNGRSYMSRRTYMDMKERGYDKDASMKELEHYIQELGSDITEMLENASPEERQAAKQKLLTLSTKIQ